MSAEASVGSTRSASSPTRASQTVFTRYFNAFRVASYLLVLYAVGHTLGAVVATPHFGPESDAVVVTMKSVHVWSQSADCTWYGFYRGFGIFVSVYFLFSVFVAWRLGGMSEQERPTLMPIAWALFVSHVAGTAVAWIYFFPTPIAFSIAITALLGFGCVRTSFGARRTAVTRGTAPLQTDSEAGSS
ncbi:MAG: hypothetical protein JWO86_5953 [Myxococcaceae bacterium]|jgi:hypothetical protein|nr:hypothetical protein [Myxococcaceae bacterium]